MNHEKPDPPPFIPLVRGVNLPSFGPWWSLTFISVLSQTNPISAYLISSRVSCLLAWIQIKFPVQWWLWFSTRLNMRSIYVFIMMRWLVIRPTAIVDYSLFTSKPLSMYTIPMVFTLRIYRLNSEMTLIL